jgi:hypothetical protein
MIGTGHRCRRLQRDSVRINVMKIAARKTTATAGRRADAAHQAPFQMTTNAKAACACRKSRPALFTLRDRGASLSKAKCVRLSL